jgi:hypothetical protein
MATLANILVFVLGLGVVVLALKSATQTLIVPRATPDRIVGVVFLTVRRLFELRLRWATTYTERDRVMAYYSPVSLLLLLPTWLGLVLVGFMGMFWAVGIRPWRTAFWESGSSLLTLGFAPVSDLPQTGLAFAEATIGLILVAMLIAYLPTMYTTFARREAAVAMLEVRAGAPPSAVELLGRAHRLGRLDQLSDLWATWEVWFADVEESHTSLAALAFFRSPDPDRSWLTAAGAVMDAAALTASAVDVPRDPQAELCIRAGYVALRRIADFFQIPYDADPGPTDSISIIREEFDAVYDELAGQRVPLKPDRDQAWRDFAGGRVNYDTVLLALAHLIMAPYAPWISDRSRIEHRRFIQVGRGELGG